MKRFVFSDLVNVPTTDPEDSRRRKLLNIILVGLAVLSFLIIFFSAIADILNIIHDRADIQLIYITGSVFFFSTIGIYYI